MKFHFQNITATCDWQGNGWLTQNSDGLAAGNSGTTRGGGLIRDGNGEWVTGFARKFGTATSFLAELWTLQDSGDSRKFCQGIPQQA